MASAISDPWGAILIGVFISLVLFGIIIMQLYNYATRFPNDHLWLKLLVWTVFLLDVLSSIFAIWWMYYLFVDNWGKIDAFTKSDWLLAADPIVAGIMAALVQSFFAWRLKIITGSRILAAFIYTCALLTLCGGIGTGIALLWVEEYTRFAEFQQIATIWLVSGVLGDLGITIALTVHLRRRRGIFKHTNKLVDHIIRMTIQNGALTAVVALTDIIMYLSTPKPYHITLSFLLPKLYTNTLLSTLVARKSKRRAMHTTDVKTDGRVTTAGVGQTEIRFRPATDITGLDTQEVYVDVETHEMRDVAAAKHPSGAAAWEYDDGPGTSGDEDDDDVGGSGDGETNATGSRDTKSAGTGGESNARTAV